MQIFGALSGIMLIVGSYPYLQNIIQEKTRPERAAYFIWSLLGCIAFFSQLAAGAHWSLLLPAIDAVQSLAVFVMSIKTDMGGFTRFDIVSVTVAIIELVLWYFTRQPLIALCITIGADAIGVMLTARKTYLHPETETLFTWFLFYFGGLFGVLATGKLSFGFLVYPVYFAAANALIAVIILVRQ